MGEQAGRGIAEKTGREGGKPQAGLSFGEVSKEEKEKVEKREPRQ